MVEVRVEIVKTAAAGDDADEDGINEQHKKRRKKKKNAGLMRNLYTQTERQTDTYCAHWEVVVDRSVL